MFLIVGVVATALFFPRAGAFLVAEDPFDHADIALILSGLPVSRAFAARDLYQQGRVGEIWVIPEPPNKVDGELVTDQVKTELVAWKLLPASPPQWAHRILVAAGIPPSKIVVLPEAVHGTIHEAPRVKALLTRDRPTSLVVITSKSASRRARLIFRDTFKETSVRVFAYPTPYDVFEPTRWWSQPRNALTVVTEYEKLLTNVLTLALRRQEDGSRAR